MKYRFFCRIRAGRSRSLCDIGLSSRILGQLPLSNNYMRLGCKRRIENSNCRLCANVISNSITFLMRPVPMTVVDAKSTTCSMMPPFSIAQTWYSFHRAPRRFLPPFVQMARREFLDFVLWVTTWFVHSDSQTHPLPSKPEDVHRMCSIPSEPLRGASRASFCTSWKAPMFYRYTFPKLAYEFVAWLIFVVSEQELFAAPPKNRFVSFGALRIALA